MSSRNRTKPKQVSLVTEPVSQIPSLSVLLDRLRDQGAEFVVLGDFSPEGPGRYSYLASQPRRLITFNRNDPEDPLAMLQSACDMYRLQSDADTPVPFVGGWIGYLSYDLARHIERLPDSVDHDIPLPLLRFGFYDAVLAWDHQAGLGCMLALQYDEQTTTPADRLDGLGRLCRPTDAAESARHSASEAPGGVFSESQHMPPPISCNFDHQQYLAAVSRARRYILDGDIFEVNLSQRFSRGYAAHPATLYDRLAAENPAGYSALLSGPDHAIVSASPELFLSRRADRIVTRPIKGTISRGADPKQDEANRQALDASQKDRAELNMIIDLERNDLGRICSYGSVEIVDERTIEAHPTVFHAVSTIAGRLRPDVSVSDILRATFPGGSISGAPKIRAMEIIDELEPTARSVYTGSIGWIGLNGDFDLNIAIRTVIIAQNRAHLQLGGAIVADSVPQDEYAETLAKGTALLNAIRATAKEDLAR